MLGTLLICATLVAVDGDNVRCDGVNMRDMGDGAPFVSGYDAPEIYTPKCDAEAELGRRAKQRMAELLEGATVYDSGEVDNTQRKRPLVWVIAANGRSVGSILIEEGLASPWTPAGGGNWC